MSQNQDRIAEIAARHQAATEGPWWCDEDEHVWRLHGVMFRTSPSLPGLPEQVMNKQIAKAPKTGTPYAEYWPEPADAEFIAHAWADIKYLLDAVAREGSIEFTLTPKAQHTPGPAQSADALTTLFAPTQVLTAHKPGCQALLPREHGDPITVCRCISFVTNCEEQPLRVFRASHGSIVLGRYTTAVAARAHCEAVYHREVPDTSLDWIEYEEDGIAELVAAEDGAQFATGYVVTALEIAPEYDEEADE